MRIFYLITLILIINSCSKDKESCYTIQDKKIISGEYYFFVNNSMGFQTSNNNLGSGVPDPYGSGKVDEETYNSLGIGDKYCL